MSEGDRGLGTGMPVDAANTEEFQDGQSNGALGEVFIRYVPFIGFIGAILMYNHIGVIMCSIL